MTLKLAHYVSLSGYGGVEQQFSQFADRAAGTSGIPSLQQSVVACSKSIHPHHEATLARVGGARREKSVAGMRLPQRPAGLRRARYRWLARRMTPDVALLWNRLGQHNRVIDVLGERRCLYWEHGSAWLAGEDDEKRRVLARLPAVLCNSHAARRMLQLRWRYAGTTRVCPNGLRPNAVPVAAQPKALPAHRALRIGVASRLVPIKATCVALHVLAQLRQRGLEACLIVAGDGPERDALQRLAQSLGIEDAVEFKGVLADMSGFYGDIDLLLHPALREPFGMVAAEAGAHGCPVVCTAVDGLPEVVEHGVSGMCVPPTLSLSAYEELGGEIKGLPPYVYRPDTDMIGEPRVCDPAALADAVTALMNNAGQFTDMSAAAIERVQRRFDFDSHVHDVMSAVREYADTGTLAERP